jgi:hypothetical protein
MELESRSDTAKVIPFSANCPIKDQIRLNVAAIEINYSTPKIRGKLQLQ